MLVTDHWNRDTVEFIAPYLGGAEQLVRIATGYFTVQGYDLIRTPLDGKRVYILVGYDEASKERLRDAMIENLAAHLRRWDAENRREAVRALVTKLQKRELEIAERRGDSIDLIDSRIRNQDHTKVYIVDDKVVLVGSSNLSRSGLLYNAEEMGAIVELERVHYWIARFEAYWSDPETVSLTAQLLAALLAWLALDSPFDIYVKTIAALVAEEDVPAPRATYKMPMAYQGVVINRMLRQLEEWRGAMLVASTGLGKTVMATHAALMMRERRNATRNILVFAPKAVGPDWEASMDSAGLNCTVFVMELLDQPRKRRAGRVKEVERIVAALNRVDEQYLIIIDESHKYSNRLRSVDERERRSFSRLARTISDGNPYVMLLTATPFTKDVDDINNQLYLLPHTAPPEHSTQNGQLLIEEFGETGIWSIPKSDDFFEDFMALPVSTVISTSQVAKNFATRSEAGDYVEFPDGSRGWIPRIYLRKVRTPVPLENEMTAALNDGLFKHQTIHYRSRGKRVPTRAIIENQAKVAWASSPPALRDVISRTLHDGYDVTFSSSREQREARLLPLLQEMEKWSYDDDPKFIELLHHVRQIYDSGRKLVLFVERHHTALYVEEGLSQYVPGIKIANTIKRLDDGSPEAKDFEEVLDLVIDFAPIANADKRAERHKKGQAQHFDVLIATNAYGVGMNLQDASVAISYDLAWTAAPIIQRAGRVLRFWRQPRDVGLYVFVPRLSQPSEYRQQASDVEARLRRLQSRTQMAEQFSELPIIPQGESAEYRSLSGLANVDVEDIGLIESSDIEEFTGVSPFLRHYQAYLDHQEYADALSDDLSSALYYDGSQPRLYLLIRYAGQYHWAVMRVRSGQLEEYSEDALLEMIQCTADTAIAEVAEDAIEVQAQRCKKLWCAAQGVQLSEEVERICALYLQPRKADGITQMLRGGS